MQPLAEVLRPQTFSEMIGQTHLLGVGKPLTVLSQGAPQSLILWGPPGVGKTTLASLIIRSWNCDVIKLSAVFSGVKEIREAIEHAVKNKNNLFAKKCVIFVDEIHRFNKIQQDAFLHHVETGDIILIGATTENPSFELNNALLSRVQVFVLNSLNYEELNQLLNKALNKIQLGLTADAKELLIHYAANDARHLLNILELLLNTKLQKITKDNLIEILPNKIKYFDKFGDDFYNQISALHKSIRGSDVDASLYWFTRMLEAGADPQYLCRRLLRISWEDIGLADINASTVVINAINTFERLGALEGELALATAVIYLASAKKSNTSYMAFNKVKEFVKTDNNSQVPLHLCNASTKFMKDLGYGINYKYPFDYQNNYVPSENYWPKQIQKQQFYSASLSGMENAIKNHLEFLNTLDKQDKTE